MVKYKMLQNYKQNNVSNVVWTPDKVDNVIIHSSRNKMEHFSNKGEWVNA